ncbi:hypothetical protein BC830DRAFT_170434 [Chytriomyces sp. MP71]|nr:hypothetical protein BC830DRAFT_170434 [Chytriomyces sp. MP71]
MPRIARYAHNVWALTTSSRRARVQARSRESLQKARVPACTSRPPEYSHLRIHCCRYISTRRLPDHRISAYEHVFFLFFFAFRNLNHFQPYSQDRGRSCLAVERKEIVRIYSGFSFKGKDRKDPPQLSVLSFNKSGHVAPVAAAHRAAGNPLCDQL